MPKGYWIARVDVHDPEGYKAYIAANAAALKKYGAKFLVRGGKRTSQNQTGENHQARKQTHRGKLQGRSRGGTIPSF